MLIYTFSFFTNHGIFNLYFWLVFLLISVNFIYYIYSLPKLLSLTPTFDWYFHYLFLSFLMSCENGLYAKINIFANKSSCKSFFVQKTIVFVQKCSFLRKMTIFVQNYCRAKQTSLHNNS